MLAEAVVPNAQRESLLEAIYEAIKKRSISTDQFVGRRIHVNGGNYTHETIISGMEIILNDLNPGAPTLHNIRLKLKDPVVKIDKGRYKKTRTIKFISYAYSDVVGYLAVVLVEDGMETIKDRALVYLLD